MGSELRGKWNVIKDALKGIVELNKFAYYLVNLLKRKMKYLIVGLPGAVSRHTPIGTSVVEVNRKTECL